MHVKRAQSTLGKRIESRPKQQSPAAQTTAGLFSLPPGTAGAGHTGVQTAAAVQNPLAAAMQQSPTGNPLLDAYSQYAALAAAGYTAAQTGHNGLDISQQQQHQQTGDTEFFPPARTLIFCSLISRVGEDTFEMYVRYR